MTILICNVGSTSLKYRLFDMDDGERVLASGGAERVGTEKSVFFSRIGDAGAGKRVDLPLPTHREAIEAMLQALRDGGIGTDTISCVGFKVVHAKGVTGVQVLTDDVLEAMAAFNTVAPAHNPPYIAAIRQFRALMPGVPLIGSFETGFHAQMPPKAYLYSIPAEVSERFAIRRYGFHGASHEYITDWVSRQMGKRDFSLISCHLGGSGSITAVQNGVSVDTSLGTGLQCGTPHNNRIGDIDPYIIFYLVEACGMTLGEVRTMLEKKSGLYGLSGGLSNDLRDIEQAAADGNGHAKNALEVYAYSVKKYIGSYVAALGGVQAVAFAGGIGRNSPTVRRMALEGLSCMGIELDEAKNEANLSGSDISRDGSPVRIWLVDTNEEIIVARKAQALLRSGRAEAR